MFATKNFGSTEVLIAFNDDSEEKYQLNYYKADMYSLGLSILSLLSIEKFE